MIAYYLQLIATFSIIIIDSEFYLSKKIVWLVYIYIVTRNKHLRSFTGWCQSRQVCCTPTCTGPTGVNGLFPIKTDAVIALCECGPSFTYFHTNITLITKARENMS